MGGPHVTFTDERDLRKFPEVDIVIRGEGEETMRELVRTLEKEESLGNNPGPHLPAEREDL